MPREAALRNLLRGCGWEGASMAPLAEDASPRRYHRLSREGATAIVMDARPPSDAALPPYIAMTGFLEAQALSVPQIIGADVPHGFLLIEDFGDELLAAKLRRSEPVEEAYRTAAEVLAILADADPPTTLPAYDMAFLLFEGEIFAEWYLTALAPQAGADDFRQHLADAVAPFAQSRKLVLRDYHAENLFWLPEREGARRIGLIDFQDARLGHPAYDLVSLLEDARLDLGDDLRRAVLASYLDRSGAGEAEFLQAYCTLGAQRSLKILGLFARLAIRDRKPRYLVHMERVWAHLKRDLSHPALAALREWTEANVPPPSASVLDDLRRRAAA